MNIESLQKCRGAFEKWFKSYAKSQYSFYNQIAAEDALNTSYGSHLWAAFQTAWNINQATLQAEEQENKRLKTQVDRLIKLLPDAEVDYTSRQNFGDLGKFWMGTPPKSTEEIKKDADEFVKSFKEEFDKIKCIKDEDKFSSVICHCKKCLIS